MPDPAGLARRVGVRPGRDREYVPAAVIQGLVRLGIAVLPIRHGILITFAHKRLIQSQESTHVYPYTNLFGLIDTDEPIAAGLAML